MKLWLEINDIEMCSIHNEGKYVVVERFIRILKIKFINTWLQFQKNVYILYHVDVKSRTYIDSSKEIDEKGPKCKVGDTIRTILQKARFLINLRKFFWLKK